MENQFYFDTRLLRDHVSIIREERKTALRLENAVKMSRDLGDPLLRSQYNRVLRRINDMTLYFEKMSDTVDQMAYDAIKMYSRLNAMITDGSDNVKNTYSKIML